MSRAALNRSDLALDALEASTSTPVRRFELVRFLENFASCWLDGVRRRVLEQGQRVTIPGFGTFYRATWSPKVGRLVGEKRHRLAFKPAESNRGLEE